MPYWVGSIAFVAAFVVSAASQPLVIAWSGRVGAVDRPGGRRSHPGEVSRLGGLAMLAGIVAGVLAAFAAARWALEASSPPAVWVGAGVGLGAIAVAGLLDDLLELQAQTKFLLQIIAAAAAVDAGLRLDVVSLPGGGAWELGLLAPAVTVFWVLLVTNAVNLTDGLDGLAASLTLVGVGVVAPLAWVLGASGELVWCFVVAGAVLGFLRYNLPPASIFMGDLGSQLLGFSLAVLSIRLVQRNPGVPLATTVAVFAVGLPVLDLGLTMLRRVRLAVAREGWSPSILVRRAFRADREHLHYAMLDLGVSPRVALAVEIGLAVAFAGAGWLLAIPRAVAPGLALCGAATLAVLFVRWHPAALRRHVERRKREGARAIGDAGRLR